ncbi:MAG: hypothetical protein ACI9MR_001341, partial [Myxococcota bacterium]
MGLSDVRGGKKFPAHYTSPSGPLAQGMIMLYLRPLAVLLFSVGIAA